MPSSSQWWGESEGKPFPSGEYCESRLCQRPFALLQLEGAQQTRARRGLTVMGPSNSWAKGPSRVISPRQKLPWLREGSRTSSCTISAQFAPTGPESDLCLILLV